MTRFMAIPRGAFLELVKDLLTTEPTSVDAMTTKLRMSGYDQAITELTAQADRARTDKAGEALKYDMGAAVNPTQLAYQIREGIDDFIIGVVTGNKELAEIAASRMNIAVLELNEVFKLLGIDGVRVGLHFSDQESNEPEFVGTPVPMELLNQFTDPERNCLGDTPLMEMFPTEEEQPYCDVQPCLGCDMRKKVNSFRALVAAEGTHTSH